MVDAFKDTLSRTEKLMWSTIFLAVALLFVDPTSAEITFLDIQLNLSRAFVVVPVILIGLLLARLVLIRNAIYIIRNAPDGATKAEIAKVVKYYPIPEFMYLRGTGCASALEGILLAAFLYLFEVVPPFTLAISWILVKGSNLPNPNVPGIAALVALIIAIANSQLIQHHIYEPLAQPSPKGPATGKKP